MERPRICVIDSSPSVRETLAIVLGDGYAVSCLSPEDFRGDPSPAHACDALIIGEDVSLGDAASPFSTNTAVLWLHPGTAAPPFATGRWATLPPGFDAQELRFTLERLLAGGAPSRPAAPSVRASIDYPLVPKEAVLLAQRAGGTTLPVLLCGAVGTGKTRLARAIHALGDNERFVQLSVSGPTHATLIQIAGLAPGSLTLLLSDLAETSAESQQLLREILDCGGVQSVAGWHPVRLICATKGSVDDLARLPAFGKDLFYRLSVLPIMLPRLRERAADIPVLVAHVSTELTRALSRPPVSFTPRALERLQRYLWFGNLAELEAVLTRTVALVQGTTIDQDDLLFGYGRLPVRPSDSPARAATAPARAPSSIETADLVINELAHEFKNPLVMIKTVSQHLERLLQDDDGREQVTRLTSEAVARMDRALENLLQFTRFRTPVPQSTALSSLLTACLSDLTALLTERRLLLDYQPSDFARVYVDSAQIVHAFENLLRVILRDLDEGETLGIRTLDAPAAAVFEFAARRASTAGKLAAFVDHAPAGHDAETPLGLVFARALVERNGGQLEVRNAGPQTTITVWLPDREGLAPGDQETVSSNGKTASPHS